MDIQPFIGIARMYCEQNLSQETIVLKETLRDSGVYSGLVELHS